MTPGAVVIPFRTIEISRSKLEAAIETLVEILDQIDAPREDLEEDNEDRCDALDDAPAQAFSDGGPGDAADAELDDQDRCAASDDDPTRRLQNGLPGSDDDAEPDQDDMVCQVDEPLFHGPDGDSLLQRMRDQAQHLAKRKESHLRAHTEVARGPTVIVDADGTARMPDGRTLRFVDAREAPPHLPR